MQKPLYFVFVLAAAMLLLGFWGNPAPSPIPNAIATSVGISVGDMHRLMDMKALPIHEVADAI